MDQLPPPPAGHRLLVEGQAAIPFSEGNEVFYNKVQEFNRDLSIHVIKLFAEKRLREKTEQALRKTRKVGRLMMLTACSRPTAGCTQQPLAPTLNTRTNTADEQSSRSRK